MLPSGQARATREAGEQAGMDARISRAFRLVCSRAPRAVELDALRALVVAETAEFKANPSESTKLVGRDDPELAALTLACTTILASDAAVMSR